MAADHSTVEADLEHVPRSRLLELAEAGQAFLGCRRRLAELGQTVVTELVGDAPPRPFSHYPRGDVYDFDSHAQYYFHRHRTHETGHFHTFLRPRGMPPGIHPADPSDWRDPSDNDALSHLVAIAVDARGEPERLFTTNRWVTAETWYRAADVKAMLPCFRIGHDRPSALLNQWITALMALFRPQIEALLDRRDLVLESHAHRLSGIPAQEDRDLEVLSEMEIDVDRQLAQLRQRLTSIG